MTTDIDTATTDLTKLDRVALARALRELPVEEWNAAVAAARRAQPYWRADLSSANLSSANLGDHKLTGRAAWIGEVSGYPVLLLATEGGHVLRAGCWTGVLDDAVERAFEEDESRLVRAEAEAVVAHGRAVLAAWTEADA